MSVLIREFNKTMNFITQFSERVIFLSIKLDIFNGDLYFFWIYVNFVYELELSKIYYCVTILAIDIKIQE